MLHCIQWRLYSMETNLYSVFNGSLSKITTPTLSWKGMRHIRSTSSISRPQFRSEDDYEVLLKNGGHQILRWVDPPTLASISSFSFPLLEPLQPVEVTDETVTTTSFAATLAILSTTSMTIMSTETVILPTSTRKPPRDTETS